MAPQLLNQILELSISERLELIESIWESIAADPSKVELTEAQCQELDNRLLVYKQHPNFGKLWYEVKQEIIGSL
ncbi:addiction module protein [Pseudanabaena sp. PCC 6802]|uniref:addiction module protein n=1 Tax=Pseudanabaena sp. PCC 6802 TaxID=118173 RepID=UPI0003458845|nr:addiction module protein [Pseudanabaena sp. PCC 6802]